MSCTRLRRQEVDRWILKGSRPLTGLPALLALLQMELCSLTYVTEKSTGKPRQRGFPESNDLDWGTVVYQMRITTTGTTRCFLFGSRLLLDPQCRLGLLTQQR